MMHYHVVATHTHITPNKETVCDVLSNIRAVQKPEIVLKYRTEATG